METLRVLIVEDNPVDAFCIKEALEEPKQHEIRNLSRGEFGRGQGASWKRRFQRAGFGPGVAGKSGN